MDTGVAPTFGEGTIITHLQVMQKQMNRTEQAVSTLLVKLMGDTNGENKEGRIPRLETQGEDHEDRIGKLEKQATRIITIGAIIWSSLELAAHADKFHTLLK